MPWNSFKRFVRLEASAGIILFFAAVIALIIDNTPWSVYYQDLLKIRLSVPLGLVTLDKSLLMWVNDGLMAIFFLLVGLEVKREVISGELRSKKQAMLPAIAAVGGMLLPALVYLGLSAHTPHFRDGWAIPTATDIAFSLGVLSLLSTRIPASLKVFLTAMAIFDDLGAIVIIAIFYTAKLSHTMLWLALLMIVLMVLLNRLRVMKSWPYIILGFILWVCVLKSGVHATLAGIVLAWVLPAKDKQGKPSDMIERWEDGLHSWVAYLILPVFAFANAGVRLFDMHLSDLWSGLTLGCALGLFIGKQLGITAFVWAGLKLGWTKLPQGLSMRGVYGVSLIAGIGFTMSLFIGSLAFADGGIAMMSKVRLGVIVGSLVSGLLGYLLLKKTYPEKG